MSFKFNRGDIVTHAGTKELFKIIQIVNNPMFGRLIPTHLFVVKSLNSLKQHATLTQKEFIENYKHAELTDLEKFIYEI